ncbi:hypothetical protein HC256_008002 [Beauveria bassiana]|nr:hypothetical protein HC256_008002 [Beauveria bassiana]
MRRSPFRAALERRQNRNGGQRQGGQDGNNGGGNGGNNGNGNNGNGNNGNGNNGNGNNGNGNNRGDNGNNGGNGNLQLDPKVLQKGSFFDGDNPGSDEQAASAVSNNNFINFCQGKTLTNGAQVRQGSCNGIVMGNIPAVEKMVSSVFVQPQNGDNLPPKQEFDIQVQMANFAPGTFTNATSNYYSAPQDTNGQGFIIGHTHVTVQDTGRGLNPQQPLNPQEFVFFKGINDAGNGQGLLSAKVAGGLPPGNYRLCSMASAANHQPVLMPIAQRGAQDDCVRFTVGGGGNGGNNNNNNGGGNNNNNGGGNNNNNGGGNNKGGGNNNNGQNRNGQNGNVQQGGGRGGLQNNGQVNDGLNGLFPGADSLFPGADSLFPGADGVFQGGKGGRRGQAGQRGLGGASQSAAVGGVAAAEVVQTNDPDRPFSTLGNSFTTQGDAVQRSCDAQRAACQEAVQSGTAEGADASACDAQLAQCISDLS